MRILTKGITKYALCFLLMLLFFISSGCGRKQDLGAPEAYNAVSLAKADALLSGSIQDMAVEIETAGTPGIEPTISLDKPSEKTIQMALKKLGLYHGKIDGKLGRKSKKAIREFQASHNLAPDGKVGPKTWSLLKKTLEEPS